MNKNRPSNVLIYVVLSLVALVGLFVFGLFLESRNWKMFDQGTEPAGDPVISLESPEDRMSNDF